MSGAAPEPLLVWSSFVPQWCHLDDNDNNHRLCLDTTDSVLSVSFPAGHVVDPNGDLNPDTIVAVTR
jgi:hypothetical protein